jgi:MFS family permease
LIVLLGGTIAISGIFASSYTTDLNTFIALYGTLSGIGTGMTYMIPLVCCMEYFPNNKGLITGIIMGSYGLGSFIFNIVATKIVNPNGENADIKTADPNLNLFSPEVANRVPMLLRILCLIWVGLVLLSVCFISIPPKNK